MNDSDKEWFPPALLKTTAAFLANKGVATPRLDAEVLLAAVLGGSRIELYAQKADTRLSAAQLSAYREFIRRRAAREPVSRILGKKEFMSLEFLVTPDVLSPRPETEILVERVLHLLCPAPKVKKSDLIFQSLESRAREFLLENRAIESGAFLPAEILSSLSATAILPENLEPVATNQLPFAAPRILELGCGSGCIAIALAKNFPTAKIVAIEISEPAIAVAKQNAERHRVETQVEFRAGNMFAALAAAEKFQFIVANPPYIPSGDREKLDPETRDYDPAIALFGGGDGLNFFREITASSAPFFDMENPEGAYLALEIGAGQADAVNALIREKFPRAEISLTPDYAGIDRVISARLTA